MKKPRAKGPRINLGTGEGRRDDWSTPDWLFKLLDEEFHFTLDVCATAQSAKCAKYYSVEKDALKIIPWGVPGDVIYMNPPYGQKELPLWMANAWHTAYQERIVVCLVPARTDSRWWHEYGMSGEIRFIQSRVNFDNGGNKAPFASTVIVFRGRCDGPGSLGQPIRVPDRRSRMR